MPVDRLTHPVTSRGSLKRLARRASDGDEEAFAQLYRRLGGGLLRFFQQRVGSDENLVEELAQHTWVEVWNALRKQRFDPQRAAFSTYLYGVGYKIYLHHLRRSSDRRPGKTPRSDLDEYVETLLGFEDDHAEVIDFCTLLDALRACLQAKQSPHALLDDERRVLDGIARGQKERAVAGDLGVAASTVNARKHTAFEKLRRCLSQKGFRKSTRRSDSPSKG